MLPTREEAKRAMENLDSLNDLNALIILEAYSSGSLIEARTEGEIARLKEALKKAIDYIEDKVDADFNGKSFVGNEAMIVLAELKALVGKV